MALSCLNMSKRQDAHDATHHDANVSPFHNPCNPQCGVIPNAAASDSGQPAPGTAKDLRARNARLRGASAPPVQWPMSPGRRTFHLRGSLGQPPLPDDGTPDMQAERPTADAQQALNLEPPAADSEEYEWDARRPGAMDAAA